MATTIDNNVCIQCETVNAPQSHFCRSCGLNLKNSLITTAREEKKAKETTWNDVNNQQASAAQRRALYRWLCGDSDKVKDLLRCLSSEQAAIILAIFACAAHTMPCEKAGEIK